LHNYIATILQNPIKQAFATVLILKKFKFEKTFYRPTQQKTPFFNALPHTRQMHSKHNYLILKFINIFSTTNEKKAYLCNEKKRYL